MDQTTPASSDTPVTHAFIGLPPLMRQAFAGADLKPLAARLIEHSAQHADDAGAMLDLSTVMLLSGYHELGLSLQMDALRIRQVYQLPAAATPRLRVLALKSAGDLMANTPVEFLLEDPAIELNLLYLGEGIPAPAELPEHDVLFVAVGESDRNTALLQTLDEAMRGWHVPVVNMPERITRLARDRAYGLLQGAPGIEIPAALRVGREALQQVAGAACEIGSLGAALAFPIIVRPVGSHAGHDLLKIDGADALGAYLNGVPDAEFYVARFVDYRSPDGQFRKYRIMLIDGQPYICHMAISSHWMIHYLNAGMAESADKRAEEARFMAGFEQDFAPRHRAAFQEIYQRFELEYVGIDCGETADGKLLVFEVDSNMIVHAMDPVEMYPYKQPVMRKLFTAFQEMLAKAAAGSEE